MKQSRSKAFTKTELLVALGIVSVLFFILSVLALPSLVTGGSLTKSRMLQTLSNMKQLYLATQQMAVDGEATTNSTLGWPSDTGASFSNWTTQLVQGGYLSTNDLAKLLSAPGVIVPNTGIPLTNNTALLLYAVKATSPTNTVFLSTANFTNTPNGGTFNPAAKPYGKAGFVVFRNSGEGTIYSARQAASTNAVGSYAPLCP